MFRCAGCYCWTRSCALALTFLVGSVCALSLSAQDMLVNGGAVAAPYAPMYSDANPYGVAGGQPPAQAAPPCDTWIAPSATTPPMYGQAPYATEPAWGAPVV